MYYIILCLVSVLALTAASTPTFKVGMARDMFLKYATSDELQYNGTKWWADWVNSQGGIKYGGISRQVEVITLDASTPDPNQTTTMVKNVYEKLINDYQVDIVIGAAATARTQASTAITEKYGVINFVVGSLTDSLFSSTKSMIYTSATPNALVPSLTVDTLIKAGAKNYVIFIRTDAYSMTQGQLCDSYLKSKGITQSGLVYINNTATDTAGLQVSLANNINLYLINKSVDIFIYSSISNEFVTMMTTFDGLKPVGVKSAVFLVGNSREALRLNGLGTIGDYWLVTTRFDPSFGLGISGQYGGTTEEFSSSFIKMHGVIPSGFDALAPAILMSYYRAVGICDTTNSTIVSATLKNMSQFDTFAFPLKYQNNGTNMFPQLKLLQYVNGVGRLVTQENLIYPMVWNKNVAYVKVAGKSNNKKIIAIAVPIGVVILAIALGASIYIRKKHKHAVKVLTETEEGERRNYMVDYSALTLGNMIGAGGFGYVFKGEYRGAAVAVKKLKVQMEKAQLQEFAKESAVMIGLRHPNILLFMGVCLVPPELCIITEFMCRGSVYDIIHNEDITLSFNLIHSIVLDVLKGLQFIHSAGIVHRDLKSPNLLVDKKWNIKIADFGLSAVKAQADDTTQVSLLWTAPEILSKQAGCYSEKSDAFSLGIIIWELLSRKTPYENLLPPAIAPAVIAGQRPTVDNSWNQHMVSLMNKCWAQNAQARCTVKEAREIVEGIYVGPEFNEMDASFQGSLNMSMIHTQNGSTKMKTDEKAVAPTGSVTFVSTSIAHANELWEHDAHGMVRALALHNELIRKTSRQEKGYEVKNSYDMFLFAFQDHVHAINFCLRMQTELMALEWPESILKHPHASEKKNTNGALLFKGLNIKMGMHITTPIQKINEQTGQVDYSGAEVAFAPRLASFAEPGLILVSPEMYAKVMITTMSRLEPFVIESCGTRVLSRGKDPVQLYMMTTRSLRERSETDDVETTDNGDNLSDSSGFYEFPVAQDLWNIKFEDLKFGPKIGAGSFGEVRSGTWNGESVAIKQVIRQKTTDNLMLDLRAESIVLRKLDHRNVLKFKGMCFQQPNLCLVTELLERGSLSTILYNPNATLTWDQKITIIRDVVNGMMYLHSKSLIHRDVKSSNLLVSTDWTVKIADFGFSRIKADNQTMTQCGTVAWTAPEIFEGAHYSEKADVYSFAIILWELIFRRKPWDNLHSMKIVSSVLAGQRPSVAKMPSNTPDHIVKLMEACWNQDPNARPNFDSMLSYIN